MEKLAGGPRATEQALLPLPRSTSPATSSLAPSSTKVSKAAEADETSFMFNSLQSLVDLANSNPKNSSTAVEPQEPPRPLVMQEPAKMVKTNSSDLVREANEKIRFSIHFDARKHHQEKSQQNSSSKFSNVREDLFKVKQDINELKNDLKTAEQPLMVRLLRRRPKRTFCVDYKCFKLSLLLYTKEETFWGENSNIVEIKETTDFKIIFLAQKYKYFNN